MGETTQRANEVLWDLLEQEPSPLLGLKWYGTAALSEPRRVLCGQKFFSGKGQSVQSNLRE